MSKNALINLKDLFPVTANDYFAPWNEWLGGSNFSRITVPALNVSEDSDHYQVTVAVPGLEKKDFDIKVEGDVLTISATSKKEPKNDKKKYRRWEYCYSSFSRAFTLPADVNIEAITASYDQGILTLNLPRNEKAVGTPEKKITVK